jgi:hypothetical protein
MYNVGGILVRNSPHKPLSPLAGFVIFGSFRISLSFSVITSLKVMLLTTWGLQKRALFAPGEIVTNFLPPRYHLQHKSAESGPNKS